MHSSVRLTILFQSQTSGNLYFRELDGGVRRVWLILRIFNPSIRETGRDDSRQNRTHGALLWAKKVDFLCQKGSDIMVTVFVYLLDSIHNDVKDALKNIFFFSPNCHQF